MTMNRDKVLAELNRDLEAVRGFERNVNQLLTAMRNPNMGADLDSEVRGLRYNQHCILLYLGRASAVLELLDVTRDGELTTGDELAGFIEAFKSEYPA